MSHDHRPLWRDDRTPYIEGRLVIPAFGIQADISFLVDTGADRTVLMPADATRSGLDFAKLDGGEDVGGVGGTISMFTQPALIALSEPGVGIHVFQVNLMIAPAAPDLERTPSLLGRDVIDRCRMLYNPGAGELALDVVKADLTLPVPPGP